MAGWTLENFSDVLPFAMLPEEGTMFTKEGRLFKTIKVVPRDFSFRPHEEFNIAGNSLRQITKYLNEGWTVWSDFDKYVSADVPLFLAKNAPPAAAAFERAHQTSLGQISHCDYYVTFCYTIPERKSPYAWIFSDKRSKPKTKPVKGKSGTKDPTIDTEFLKEELYKFNAIFKDIFSIFKMVYDQAEVLDSAKLLSYLHSTYSFRQNIQTPSPPVFLDILLADRTLYDDPLTKLDDEYVITATLTGYPAETRASMFAELVQSPYTFRFSTRYIFYSPEKAAQVLGDHRANNYSKRKGPGDLLAEQVLKEPTELLNPQAIALTDEITEAMETLKDASVTYGEPTTVIVIRDKSQANGLWVLERIREIIRKAEFMAKAEDMNNTQTFLGIIPGNVEFNPRKVIISSSNFIHFLPQHYPWSGDPINDHLSKAFGEDAPHMVTKTGSRLFYYNRNVGMVGHGLLIGPTGAGKSVHLNAESISVLAHYDSGNVITFDVDKSSKACCLNCGGDFYDLGSSDSPILLNPFYQLDTPSDVDAVTDLFSTYFQSKGLKVTSDEEEHIRSQLHVMSKQLLDHRTFDFFSNLMKSLDNRYKTLLDPFVSGAYSKLFAPVKDDFSAKRWIVFELRTLMEMGDDILRFCLNYIFHKVEKLFDGTKFFLLNIDEGWKALMDPVFGPKFLDWLRTLRKKHVYVTLATQNISELHANENFEVIANQCPHRVFLPNPMAMKFTHLYQTLSLELEDIEALADPKQMRPQRHYLYCSPTKGKQIYELCLDQTQLDILTKPLGGFQ